MEAQQRFNQVEQVGGLEGPSQGPINAHQRLEGRMEKERAQAGQDPPLAPPLQLSPSPWANCQAFLRWRHLRTAGCWEESEPSRLTNVQIPEPRDCHSASQSLLGTQALGGGWDGEAAPTKGWCQACAGQLISTPSGMTHARMQLLLLASRNQVAAAELIKEGGRQAGGSWQAEWLWVPSVQCSAHVPGPGGGWEMGGCGWDSS